MKPVIAGLGLLFGGFIVCVFWCVGAVWNNDNVVEIICGGAVASALAASAVHSIVDFVWYIPACMSWTLILCGLACRLYQMRRAAEKQPSFSSSRLVWMGVTVIVAILSIGSVQVLVRPAEASRHWDNYAIYAKERQTVERQMNAFSVDPKEKDELSRLSVGIDKILEAEMRAYLAKDLNNASAHLRMAAVYLRQFQGKQRSSINPMGIGQIRDAAIASQFPSKGSDERMAGTRDRRQSRTLISCALARAAGSGTMPASRRSISLPCRAYFSRGKRSSLRSQPS